jgi:hypothetical protein
MSNNNVEYEDLMSIDHVPRHMCSLPRDLHGRPIPWFAWVGDDGRALVTVLDQEKWHRAVESSLCWICGEPLGPYKAEIQAARAIALSFFPEEQS